jgi:hypothetical protein
MRNNKWLTLVASALLLGLLGCRQRFLAAPEQYEAAVPR